METRIARARALQPTIGTPIRMMDWVRQNTPLQSDLLIRNKDEGVRV
jgi:hypothetical protein